MTPDEALAALDELRAARLAGKAAEEATPGAVVEALKTGVTAAEIARRIGLSEGYVRKFRREAKLQDKRYAHLKPPAATVEQSPVREPEPWAETSMVATSTPKYAPVPDDILRWPIGHLTKLAASIEKRQGAVWVADVLSRYPGEAATFRPYRIVEQARNQDLVADRDLYPQEP